MNEKMIMSEINSSMIMGGAGGEQQIASLQSKVQKYQDSNRKRASDLMKLKQSLERLRCDLHVLYLSKKLNKESQMTNDEKDLSNHDSNQNVSELNGTQEQSADSDKIVKDQIQNTLDFIQKIEQNLHNDLQNQGDDALMSPDMMKERRLGGPMSSTDKKHDRKRSHTVDQRKMDTTMMSEIEYINIFPDMEKLED